MENRRRIKTVRETEARRNEVDGARPARRGSAIRVREIRTVQGLLFERLRALILSGRYASGKKLREEELARAFGVSRTPVREALRRLESEGLVHYLPHRGVVVNQISYDDLAEIYPLRAVIEGLAARLAAQRITAQDLAMLKALQREMDALLAQGEYHRARRVHTRFNMTLYRASGNRRLIGILAQFNDYIEHTISRAFAIPGRAAEIRREHAAMLSAIDARDQDAAEKAARRHVENARRAFAGEPRQPV